MDVVRRFRRSLKHTPQPVPFITELFGAEVRVEKSFKALTLQPLPFLKLSADSADISADVEVEGRKVYLLHRDNISGLCLFSYHKHEVTHIHQVYSDEGSKIYEEFERFVNAIKKGRNFEFGIETEYKKLEVYPTLCQYFYLTFPEIHIDAYHMYRDENAPILAKAVEKHGKELGYYFRKAVMKNKNHRVALDYEKYLSRFGGKLYFKYYKLLHYLYVFTFSKYNFETILRPNLCDANLHPKDVGIDLKDVEGRLNELKKLGGSTGKRAEFLLNHLPKADTLDDFIYKTTQFRILMPTIIYYESKEGREKKRRTYALKYKSKSRIWLGYHIDLSIAFQIRRAKLIKNKDDPRRQVRCPFSESEQFRRCEDCLGLLYPEKSFNGKCKFLKEWSRSEGLKVLYG